MLDSERRGFSPDIMEGAEEEVDVEQMITSVEEKCADFISSDNSEQFEEIFDAARRTYADSDEARKEWDLLFENLESGLTAAEDEEEADSILHDYVKKANALG